MNFNLSTLKKYFSINKKEAAGFMLMLLHLKPGEGFRSIVGKVERLENGDFRIDVDDETVKNLISLWTKENKDLTKDLFN